MTDEEAETEAEKLLSDFFIMREDEWIRNLSGLGSFMDRRSWIDGFTQGYLKGKREGLESIKPIN